MTSSILKGLFPHRRERRGNDDRRHLRIEGGVPTQRVAANRQGRGANVAWFDGHVTYASGQQINAL
ncbi:MAG: hypothetical protein D4R65_04755 [Verrucomicrobiaceae bacterium]|nr:MAG: hypothetical protein D4R65_04755 [Verrucomicrobiaceae bacterium]